MLENKNDYSVGADVQWVLMLSKRFKSAQATQQIHLITGLQLKKLPLLSLNKKTTDNMVGGEQDDQRAVV